MTYHGVILETGAVVLPNESGVAEGFLPFVAVGSEGLTPRAASFAFRVLAPTSSTGIYLEEATAFDGNGPAYEVGYVSAVPTIGLPDALLAERPSLERLAAHLDPGIWSRDADGPLLTSVPGELTVLGDAFPDGLIDGMDAMAMMSVANGNVSCGSNPSGLTIDCLAGNVFPRNLPGIGEAGDPCPPGADACAGWLGGSVTLNDAMLIQWKINNPGPGGVVGRQLAERIVAACDPVAEECPPCEPSPDRWSICPPRSWDVNTPTWIGPECDPAAAECPPCEPSLTGWIICPPRLG